MAHDLIASDRHQAKAASIANGDPDAGQILLLSRCDGGKPTAEGALIEIGGEEAGGEHDLKQREMTEREKSDNQGERSESCERDRVEAAAESDIEYGAEQERPEAGRDGDGSEACNGRFGNLAVA
ncbi:MAG: hypothetical protein ABSE36_07760 [Terracidiphilus sp.]